MTVPLRKYNTSDVNMLTAGKVINSNALRHIVIISGRRPDFDNTFFTTHDARIDNAFRNILGLDPYRFLRPLTHEVQTLFIEALDLLITFHKQMERGYRAEKGKLDSLFTKLGFNEYWKEVSVNKNQNQMADLLVKFDSNMSANLETQVYDHHIEPGIIANIRSKVQPYIDANVAQEAQKPVVHEITSAEIIELNEIYEVTMDICVVCWDIFKKDHIIREEFSFTKIVSNMGNHTYRPVDPPTE